MSEKEGAASVLGRLAVLEKNLAEHEQQIRDLARMLLELQETVGVSPPTPAKDDKSEEEEFDFWIIVIDAPDAEPDGPNTRYYGGHRKSGAAIWLLISPDHAKRFRSYKEARDMMYRIVQEAGMPGRVRLRGMYDADDEE